MRKHPKQTIYGLIPVAGDSDRLAKSALKYLQDLHLKGHTKALKSAIQKQPEATALFLSEKIFERETASLQAAEQLDEQSTPEWLRDAIADMETAGELAKLPRWLPLSTLPSIYIGTLGLNATQTVALIAALRLSTLKQPYALVEAIQQRASAASTQAFAAALFNRWQKEDMPAANKWVMWAAVHFCSGEVATKLGPLVVKWRKQLKHARVIWGLEALAEMQSDAALMQIHYISQKAHRPGLRKRAANQLKIVAAIRGLSTIELADRMVPDCGLDSY